MGDPAKSDRVGTFAFYISIKTGKRMRISQIVYTDTVNVTYTSHYQVHTTFTVRLWFPFGV